jgi:hypothetical protein
MRIDVMEKPKWFATNDDGSKAWADACFVDEIDGEDVFLGYRECAAPAEQEEGEQLRTTPATRH